MGVFSTFRSWVLSIPCFFLVLLVTGFIAFFVERVLKNSGFLPPVVKLRNDIRRTKDLLCTASDSLDRYSILEKLNFLVSRCGALSNATVAFEIPQRYYYKAAARFKSGNSK